MADSETDLRQILWEEQHMNQEIKIAVCDDLAEDRENITRLLSEYTDPKDADLNQIFYTGAGMESESLTDSEKQAYLKLTFLWIFL